MAPKKHSKTGPKARKAAKVPAKTQSRLVSKTTVTRVTRERYEQIPRGRKEASLHTRSVDRDDKRVAREPGRRVSANGNVYYERRENRSDTPAQREKAMKYRQLKSNERQARTMNKAAKKSASKGKRGKK